MKTFTNNWFEITGIRNFEKYVKPLKGDDLIFLEVGCYEGQASCWMMQNTNAKLTVVDTFAGGQDLPAEVGLLNRFKENTKDHTDRIEIFPGRSRDRLRDLTYDVYEFIYIDGSHLAADTLEDMVLSFRLLKKGGIMIIDDYTWGQGMPFHDIPRTGIDAFLIVYGNQLEILEKNSQVVIKKK